MRKFVLIAVVALSACLGLSACNKQGDEQTAQEQVQKAPKPTDINDAKAWNAYLGQLVQANLQGMKAPQPYAYLVTAGDSRWQGHTSEDYWAFVGPFGGCTAATILRALMEHPQRAGDPTAITVNYCAPVAKGPFDLDLRLVKANRSSQHWCVEMTQGNGDVSTLATAVFHIGANAIRWQVHDRPEETPRFVMDGTLKPVS